jgi:hypothetical protein
LNEIEIFFKDVPKIKIGTHYFFDCSIDECNARIRQTKYLRGNFRPNDIVKTKSNLCVSYQGKLIDLNNVPDKFRKKPTKTPKIT